MRRVMLAVGLALAAGAETWQAVQTPNGYLWASSGVQVHRYDGRRFVAFGEAEGLVAWGVTYLAGTCPGILEDGGLEGRADAARILLAGDGTTELICGAMAYDPSLRPIDATAFGLAVAERLGEGR